VHLYLASTSPARLQTLRQAGIEPITIPPGVDEEAVVAAHEREHGPLSIADLVQLLARTKAEAVVGMCPDGAPIDGLIIGSDSAFLTPEGDIQGKPHRPDVATARWRAQSGGTGQLWSGQWLIDHRGGTARCAVGRPAVATVHFAALDGAEIEAYVATGEPLLVAGAFTVDSLGGPFITGVHGDPSTVIGLSLSTLRDLVRELDVSWPSLWNRPR